MCKFLYVFFIEKIDFIFQTTKKKKNVFWNSWKNFKIENFFY